MGFDEEKASRLSFIAGNLLDGAAPFDFDDDLFLSRPSCDDSFGFKTENL